MDLDMAVSPQIEILENGNGESNAAAEVSRIFENRYRIAHDIKHSSAVSTFAGVSSEGGDKVFIKALRCEPSHMGMQMRLEHEAMNLAGASCQWLAPLLEVKRNDNRLYLVFQYIDGIPLTEYVTCKRLDIRGALQLGLSIFSALNYLHEREVLHRDIKPANLLVHSHSGDLSATLVDLGPSNHTSSEVLNCHGALATACYLSPEQAGSIDHDMGPDSDLYAGGTVLFFALTGHPPFMGDTVGDILFKHMTSPMPELASLGVSVPRAVEEILQRLLRKDPRDRYQSASAVLNDLQAVIQALDRGEEDPEIIIGASDVRFTLTEPAFVSRGHELKRMNWLIDETSQGHGGLVQLEADSGSGKSRLLTEIAQRAARKGTWVLRGKQSHSIGQRPLQLFDDVVAGIISHANANPDLAQSIRQALKDDEAAVVSSLPPLENIFGSTSVQDLGPEAFGEARSLRALTTLLDTLGSYERPTIILLDDCQWADELTLKLLQRWTAQGTAANSDARHVLVVLAYRSEEVDNKHALRQMDYLEHLSLSPLSDKDVHRIAESMAGPLPNSVLDTVTQLSEGNPFMASAVLRGLVESNALVGDSNGWHVDPDKLNRIQSSSQAAELLTQRLELLGDDTIKLLSFGAILGKEFDLAAAALLTDQTPSLAIAALDKARRRYLVWVKPDQAVCVFVHDKIRSALLAQLSPEEQISMHQRVALHLRSQSEYIDSELAFHFDAAGDSRNALPHALVAAAQARSLYAFEIAEQQYRIAERGATDSDPLTKYRVAQGLGDVLMLRGNYDSASCMFNKAAEYAQGKRRLAQIRGKLADLALKRGDMDMAVVDYELALRTLGTYIPRRQATFVLLLLWESIIQVLHTYLPWLFLGRRRRLPEETERLAHHLLCGLSHGYWYARSKTMTMWCHLKGMNWAETYLPTMELAHTYSSHAPAMTLLPLHRRAIRYAEKSQEICRSFGDIWGEGQSLSYLGCVLYAGSQFERSVEKCQEAVRLLERMGDYWQVHIARYQIAASLHHLGQFGEAIEQAKLNHQSGLELGDEQASGIILDVWARSAFGAVPEELLQQELNRTRHDAQGKCQVLFAKAVCMIHAGNSSEAVKLLLEAIGVARVAGVKNAYTLPTMTWLATALRSMAQEYSGLSPMHRISILKQADVAARRAVRAARICRNDLPRALREQAILGAMRGVRESKFHKLFNRSLEVAERLGEEYEYAKTMEIKGQIGLEMGWPNAADQLASGQSLIAQLKAEEWEHQQPDDPIEVSSTLSLADRFDTVLDSGRKIASALSTKSIYQGVHTAALRLLRGERCLVLEIEKDSDTPSLIPIAGDMGEEIDHDLAMKAITSGCAVTCHEEFFEEASKLSGPYPDQSMLCVPISVRDRAAAVLVVINRQVAGLFGENERRLADYIACLAGAAMENAEGFNQLQNLNETLEQRVANRTAAAESRTRELKQSNQELERVAEELRQAEDELKVAIREVESASRAKSQFLATMSHEIRTPMNGVLGMTELALNTPLTLQQQNYLKTIKQSGDALLTLLNDVLDLSKVEAGRMELEHIPFDIHNVVEGAVRLMAAAAAKKGLELLCRVATTVPPLVVGDPNRLRQMLVNLVGNAIKFTHQGEVFVEVEMASRVGNLAQLEFSVQDTGIGIPTDKQESVFEAFRQSDSSTTRQYGGTGLGLAITATLVKLMEGNIRLDSKEGQGSTFHLDIPFHLPPEGTAKEIPALELQDFLVLLCCRNPRSLLITEELLVSHGATVLTAQNPEQALARIEHADDSGAAHRAALLDVDMGAVAMDRLASRLQAGAEAKPWLLVALVPAAQVDTKSLEQFSHCLTKPATTSELLLLLSESKQTNEIIEQPGALDDPLEKTEPLKILLAEDSPVNQEVASGILEIAGHRVTTVDDGKQAVEAVIREDFDVVLMDIEMPTMDGLEATSKIRQSDIERVRSTPIIAMTAHAVSGFRDQCREVGMDGYIAKPIQPAELFQTLESVVARGPIVCG
jgi:signal transduction histidine kinase/CheY-like chemotaxis protein/serine/threonine protein kinase